jgi:hypothetical protein
MSAFTSAVHDEDSDTINQLRAENTRLRQALLTLHGTLEKTARVGAAYVEANETLRDSMIRWAARAEQAEELLEAIGAGGVGSLTPKPAPDIWALIDENQRLRAELKFNTQPEAEREAIARVIGAARGLLTWIEFGYRPPVRDQIEAGRMVRVRLHALADLHDAIVALGSAA